MTNKTHCQIGQKTLLAVSKNPSNISFLVRSFGISLVIFTVIVSIGTTIVCGGVIKKYIESKIEKW